MLNKSIFRIFQSSSYHVNNFQKTNVFRAFSDVQSGDYRELLKSKKQIQLDMTIRSLELSKKPFPKALEIQKQRTATPEPLKFKLQKLPINHDPLIPLGNVEHLPFFVQRTKSHNLPVYRDYRQARHQKITIVRRLSGNFEELMTELKKITSNADVECKVGKILIKGLHKQVVVDYLIRLGF